MTQEELKSIISKVEDIGNLAVDLECNRVIIKLINELHSTLSSHIISEKGSFKDMVAEQIRLYEIMQDIGTSNRVIKHRNNIIIEDEE